MRQVYFRNLYRGSQMNLLIFASLVAAALAVPAPTCVVTNWGEWSECRGTHVCNPPVPKTSPVSDEQKALGVGRKNMMKMMAHKKALWAAKEECLQQGTCPEHNMPASKPRTDCVNGFAGEYPCRNVHMLSFTNFNDLGFTDSGVQGNDMWVWHDTVTGDDYAIVGLTHGTSFVRITDPENPEVMGILRTQTVSSTWRDMKVVNDHAFIGSEAPDHGVQIFDMTQLRGLSADATREWSVTAHYPGVGQSHNIVSNPENNRIFIVGSRYGTGYILCDGGPHTIDVTDPKNPQFLGCYGGDGYTHDAQCVIYPGPDQRYVGREICFSYNEDSFTIVDTTDPSETGVVLVSRVVYDGVQYSHQGWSSEDFTLNFLDDELDEYNTNEKNTKTFVWDITDLENPVVKNVFISSETSIDHNLYVTGNYIHQSNYEAGYRLLEIDFTTDLLSEVAYFDVFPSRTEADFYGTWSNYPWLNNGVVAVNSIDYGFFMLQVDFAAIEAEKAANFQYGKMERFREAVYGPQGTQCPALVEVETCSPQSC